MYGCTAEVQITDYYPPVDNHEEQVTTVKQVVKETFGEESFSDKGLPVYASEDFSFFL